MIWPIRGMCKRICRGICVRNDNLFKCELSNQGMYSSLSIPPVGLGLHSSFGDESHHLRILDWMLRFRSSEGPITLRFNSAVIHTIGSKLAIDRARLPRAFSTSFAIGSTWWGLLFGIQPKG